jgi:hypothetical protein
LLNRSHSNRDIFLPLDAQDHRAFEAIDGMHTIAEIAGTAGVEASRRLFEQLWWHDQVVFDPSRQRSG